MAAYSILDSDKAILRELAKKQFEVANSQVNLDRVEVWKALHRFKPIRPTVQIELGSFGQEFIPQRLKCEGNQARSIESTFYSNLINLTEFDDDKVVAPYYSTGYWSYFKPFGLDVTSTHAEGSLGHHFTTQIHDLHEDYHKIKESVYGINKTDSLQYKNFCEEIFGDILPVQMTMGCLYAVPTQQIVHLMEMETMFVAMYDYPDEFHGMMKQISDDYVAHFKMIEKEGCLLPTTTFEPVGQGTFSFTDELPQTPKTTQDVWGFLDSQETVGISPDMFHEFIFPYYKKIAEQFGLLSYGCCEPVDTFWNDLKTLGNLRKVSISPWCNEEFMGEQLRGSKTIFHRKPSPNFIGIGKDLDEDAFRAHIRRTVEAAKGCVLEFTQRDVYTVNSDVEKVRKYIKIVREESERHQY